MIDGDARLEPAHDLPGVIAAIAERIGLHRRPRAGGGWELEARWHDADDLVRNAVDHDRSPDRIRARLEPIAPDAVAQDDGLGRADAVFLLAEVAAECGSDAEHVEHGPRHNGSGHEVGAVAGGE